MHNEPWLCTDHRKATRIVKRCMGSHSFPPFCQYSLFLFFTSHLFLPCNNSVWTLIFTVPSMLSHANASSLDTTTTTATRRCFADTHNQQQDDACKEPNRHPWYFDGSGQLVSPKGACYTIAPSILKSQSHDAFSYNKPPSTTTTLTSVTSSSSFQCGQPNSKEHDHDYGQQQQHPMTTSRAISSGGGDKEKQEDGSPGSTTHAQHPLHQHPHQSHRKKRSRRYRGRKGI